MDILSLQVRGYRRFGLNPQLKQFTYTPTANLQLVLGSNEAGKSTLFSLLIPNVVEHTDLSQDGYIILTLIYGGDHYTISLIKNPHVHYSLTKNNEELNKSGKQTEQRSLIETIFNLDKDAYNIIINELKFTDMSSSLRKKILMNLSSFDFTFAMDLYNKINVRRRELDAIKKHTAKRLLTETEKEISDDEYKDIEKKKERLEKRIDVLRGTISKFPKKKIHEAITMNNDGVLQQVSHLNSFVLGHGIDIMKLDESKEALQGALIREELTIEDLVKQLEVIDKLDVSMEDVEELEKDRNAIQQVMNNFSLNDYTNFKINEENTSSTIDYLKAIFHDVETILLDLPEDPDRVNNQPALNELDSRIRELTEEENKITFDLNDHSNRLRALEHLKNHDKQHCPNCDTDYYTKYDREEHKLQHQLVKDLADSLKKRKDALLIARPAYANMNDYIERMHALKNLTGSNLPVSNIFKELARLSLVRDSPKEGALNFILKVIEELEGNRTYYTMTVKLSEIEGSIKTYHDLKNQRVSMGVYSVHELEEKLLTATNLSGEIKLSISILEHVRELKNTISEMLETHSGHSDKLKQSTKEVFEKEVTQLAEEDIRSLTREVNKIDLILGTYSSLSNIIGDLERELKEITVREEEYKDTVQQLSPVKGLIAQALDGSIGNIVNSANYFLSKIWSSKFRLSKPDVSKGSSYRFKVSTQSGDTSDISLVSDGMEDVINLAFKLVFMKAKGYDNFPLLLDEYGRALDEANRIRGYEYILNHISAMNFSTIFIISHYSSLYSMFSNKDSEFTILDDTNIDLTMVVNKLNTALKLD